MSGVAFPAVRLAVEAMATRFELVLPHGDAGLSPTGLRAAGELALAEIVAAEALLSTYRVTAQLAQINARAFREPVRVAPVVFELLRQAREGSRRTGGAFDPTVGALVRAWREIPASDPHWADQLAAARESTGWRHVELNPESLTIRFQVAGVRLDLGGVGKGWALDRAVEALREAGVTRALLHGGTSSVVALGAPPNTPAWRIQLGTETSPSGGGSEPASPASPFNQPVFLLHDTSLSVSATWGRLHHDPRGGLQGHVIDPRTGEPVPGPRRAVVVGPLAMETDLLSTALLVAGTEGLGWLRDFGDGVQGWVESSPGFRPAVSGVG